MAFTDFFRNKKIAEAELLERESTNINGTVLFFGHAPDSGGVRIQAFDLTLDELVFYKVKGPKFGSRTWYLYEVARNHYLISMYQPPNRNKFLHGILDVKSKSIEIQAQILSCPNSADRLFVGGCQYGKDVFIFHEVYVEGYGTRHEMYRIDTLAHSYSKHLSATIPVGPLAMCAINDRLYVLPADDQMCKQCLVVDFNVERMQHYKEKLETLHPDPEFGYPEAIRLQLECFNGLLWALLKMDKQSDTHELWTLDVDTMMWKFERVIPTEGDSYCRFTLNLEGHAFVHRPSTVYLRHPQLLSWFVSVPSLRYLAALALKRN